MDDIHNNERWLTGLVHNKWIDEEYLSITKR
jgi:hypothetical protein